MLRVAWSMNRNGYRGHGSYINADLAQDWVTWGNREHPDMRHWLEEPMRIHRAWLWVRRQWHNTWYAYHDIYVNHRIYLGGSGDVPNPGDGCQWRAK